MTAFRVAVLPGDGIGPEVTRAAMSVLSAACAVDGVRLETSEHAIGGAAVRSLGSPLPAGTLAACQGADAVFLGAVGDPAFENEPRERKPETGLLALRRGLGVFANIRPARVLPGLENLGPLKPEVAAGLDVVIVRELLGGLYFGEPRGFDRAAGRAVNSLVYTKDEVVRIAEVAFRIAEGRRGLVTSVDKANVLETSVLWRETVIEVGKRFPSVRLEHQYVDSCAMALVLTPAHFDVVLTENLFGDILSDEAGALVGSLGLLPSASLGAGPGLFEPVHGSAPALAGRDVANPVGAILSAALLAREGLSLEGVARRIEGAVTRALSGGRTADLAGGGNAVSASRFTANVLECLEPALTSRESRSGGC
ncbi:MAG: 3-isopropylmalate dehydrogenase [Acidobacteria bacterium]|nr:3-isopropylmalate dehydrogenase [Acidobacteriota bacterium]